MMKTNIKLAICTLAGLTAVASVGTIFARNISFNARADVDTHTVVFSGENMTISENGETATLVANRKYGGTMKATMSTTVTSYAYFINSGSSDDLFYSGYYYYEDSRYSPFTVTFTADFNNVGTITPENVKAYDLNYDCYISNIVSVKKMSGPYGTTSQRVHFSISCKSNQDCRIRFSRIEITYPCA